jgi:hypothetical protein
LRSASVPSTTSIAKGQAGGGEPAGDARLDRGAEVVAVGQEGMAVAVGEEPVQGAARGQGQVHVAVAGRAPLLDRLVGPLDRREAVGAQAGLAVLDDAVDAFFAGSGRQRVLMSAEGVEEQQREADAVAPAQRPHLGDHQLEERAAVARLHQRLRAVEAHARAQAAVELDHDRVGEGVRRRLRQVLEPRHIGDRLELAAGQRSRRSFGDFAELAPEHRDRGIGHAGVAHLGFGCLQSVHEVAHTRDGPDEPSGPSRARAPRVRTAAPRAVGLPLRGRGRAPWGAQPSGATMGP